MLEYWILFISILLCFIFVRGESPKTPIIFYTIIICEVLLGGLRGLSVGTDTNHYVSILQSISKGDSLKYSYVTSRDSAFWNIYGCIYMFLKNYTLVFILHSLLNWSMVSSSIKRISTNCFLALLVYISFRYSDMHLSGMRQGIAMAFIIYSFKYVLERNVRKYIFIILVSAIFHKSALIAFPLYWIFQYDIKKIPPLYIFILMGIFFFARHILYNNLFSLLLQNDTYDVYLKTTYEHGYLYYILYLVAFILCYIFHDKEDEQSGKFLLLAFVGILLQSITLANPIFNRVSVYFTVSFIFLIPRVYSYNSSRYGMQVPTLFVSVFLIGLYALGGPAPGIVPYKFFWE